MNHCVPDFEMEDDYSIPSSSGLTRPRKSPLPNDDIMELLWQNGQVVMQSQNQRSNRKISPVTKYDADIEMRSSQGQVHGTGTQQHHQQQQQQQPQHQQQLFMQEDEMASWLHYPLVDEPSLDHNFCSDFLYPASCVNTANSYPPVRTPPHVSDVRPATIPAYGSRPPVPPPARMELEPKLQSFLQLPRNKASLESRPSTSKSVVRESTVVDSSDTPAGGQQLQLLEMVRRSSAELSNANLRCGTLSGGGVAATTSSGGVGGGEDFMTCDVTVTSSPGDSSASAELVVAAQKPPAEDRKRKGKEGDDTECCQSEDVDFESAEAKKPERTTSTKRSRAAEVHNLSERRRRDRINEKMKALQELIPRCNKSDKASMLDEAIEYLKSLQLQVQMMSMGCGMVPMMFPGVQQYMPQMGMGIGMGLGMGMGMGMEMGINRPIMPFPNVLAGSAMTAPGATTHLGPRFPMPPFHVPHVPPPADPSRIHAPNQSDQMLNSLPNLNPNQSRIPNYSDPYHQQYLGQHQMQLPLHQNQPMVQPCIGKPGTIRGPENLHNR